MNQFTNLFDRMANGVDAFGRSVTKATNLGGAVASRRTARRWLLGRIAKDARARREAQGQPKKCRCSGDSAAECSCEGGCAGARKIMEA